MPRRPPFANLTDYAQALGKLIPDRKGGLVDADLCLDALRVYNERAPCVETADIGDGSTFEWTMGASPFTLWNEGFSDAYPVLVEELSGGDPQRPQVWWEEERLWWFERRTVSGAPKRLLVFESAPDTDQVRVHWSRRYRVDDAASPTNEVPEHHQMAVVYEGAALKCMGLVQVYRSMVDGTLGSLTSGVDDKADGYERDAKKWHQKFLDTLGVGRGPRITHGRCNPHVPKVFRD